MTDYELLETLKRKTDELKKIKNKIEARSKSISEGILKFETKRSGKTYYYFLPSGNNKKQYLKKSELSKASALAQRDYDNKGKVIIDDLMTSLEQCINTVSASSLEHLYEKLPQERKVLIKPLVFDRASYIRNWENVAYDSKPFSDDAPVHITEKGERVRSKSEVMIANALYHHGIPYKYEFPILCSGIEIRPDFTVLNPNTCQEYIWEHFGMMDDIVYCEDTIRKLSLYQENKILPGKKLISTYESRRYPLNKQIIDQIIREYLLK